MAETHQLAIPDWMVIDAVRYALGRITYQVDTTTRWLLDHWSELGDNARAVIVRDITRAFEINQVGMAVDRACWARVLELAGVPVPESPEPPRYRYPVLSAEEAAAEELRRAKRKEGQRHG